MCVVSISCAAWNALCMQQGELDIVNTKYKPSSLANGMLKNRGHRDKRQSGDKWWTLDSCGFYLYWMFSNTVQPFTSKLVALLTQGMNHMVNLHIQAQTDCSVQSKSPSDSFNYRSILSNHKMTHTVSTRSQKNKLQCSFFFYSLSHRKRCISRFWIFLYRRITFCFGFSLWLAFIWIVPALNLLRSLGVFLGIWNFYTQRGAETVVQR